MNMKSYLEQYSHTALAMNDIEILPEHIRVVMVNECAPLRNEDDFYGNTDGEYAVSLRSFFSDSEPAHLLARGIYVTNAASCQNQGKALPNSSCRKALSFWRKS